MVQVKAVTKLHLKGRNFDLKIKFAAGKIYGEGDRVQPFKEPASTAATRNKVN